MNNQFINQVIQDEIELLDQHQLVSLLDILLHLESNKYGIKEQNIHVPGNIYSPDGGEDGRIIWKNQSDKTEFIPNRFTIFQVKAMDMGPQKCYDEVVRYDKKGHVIGLKPQLEDLRNSGGAFIMFSTDGAVEQYLTDRKEKLKTAFNDCGISGDQNIIEFYNSYKIMDWTNNYTSAIAFVKASLGKQRGSGIQMWKELNERKKHLGEFFTNDIIDGFIEKITSLCQVNGQVIRILGHSGIGKTRIVIQAFSPNNNILDPLIQHTINLKFVYYDAQHDPKGIIDFVQNYYDSQSAIIVVDNCPINIHKHLAEIISSLSSLMSLISIDYDIESEVDYCIHLKNEFYIDIIEKMVTKYTAGRLDPFQLSQIIEYTEGYPAMAVMYADALLKDSSSYLKLDKDLVSKLVWGREEKNEEAEIVLKACSIFTSLGFRGSKSNEYKFVAERICNTDSQTFHKHCISFIEKKEIIELIGEQIRVKPIPLAVRLACEWWNELDIQDAEGLFQEIIKNGLGDRLVKRIGKLDQITDHTRKTLSKLMDVNGPFGNAEVLNTALGSRLFRHLSEVNPEQAVNTLIHCFGDWDFDQFTEIKGGRREIVWTLEKLCFHKDLFDKATKFLFKLAIAENEDIANNATGQLLQLFQARLPGTQANYKQRIDVIQWALNLKNESANNLALNIINRALQTDQYTRMGGTEKQGGKILSDYDPPFKETIEYWDSLLLILKDRFITKPKNDYSIVARNIIINSLRRFVSIGAGSIILPKLKDSIQSYNEFWPEAIDSITQTISFESNKLSKDQIKLLNDLVKIVEPKSFIDKYKSIVKKPLWSDFRKKEGEVSYTDKHLKKVDQIIEENRNEIYNVNKYYKLLYQGEQQYGYYFGKSLGKYYSQSQIIDFIRNSLEKIKTINEDERDFSVIGGSLSSLEDKIMVNKLIKIVIEDKNLNHAAFYLTKVSGTNYNGIIQLFKLIELKSLEINEFLKFEYGHGFENLSVDEILRIIDRISNYGIKGKAISFMILAKYSHFESERWYSVRSNLLELICDRELISNEGSISIIDPFMWENVGIKLFKEAKCNSRIINSICGSIEKNLKSVYSTRFETACSNVLEFLIVNCFERVWKCIKVLLLSDNPILNIKINHLLGSKIDYYSDKPGILFLGNLNEIFIWCCHNTPTAPRIISMLMPIFKEGVKSEEWHPFTLKMINRFGEDQEFLNNINSNLYSFSWIGSTIPLLNARLKILKSISDHKFSTVRSWAQHAIKYTERELNQEKVENAERYLL